MKREIDLLKVKVEGIDRKSYTEEQMKEICKQAGHMIFSKADSHEMLEIGRDLLECKPISIHEDVAEKIKVIVKENFLFFVSYSINKYIKEEFEKPLPKSNK